MSDSTMLIATAQAGVQSTLSITDRDSGGTPISTGNVIFNVRFVNPSETVNVIAAYVAGGVYSVSVHPANRSS